MQTKFKQGKQKKWRKRLDGFSADCRPKKTNSRHLYSKKSNFFRLRACAGVPKRHSGVKNQPSHLKGILYLFFSFQVLEHERYKKCSL